MTFCLEILYIAIIGDAKLGIIILLTSAAVVLPTISSKYSNVGSGIVWVFLPTQPLHNTIDNSIHIIKFFISNSNLLCLVFYN